MLSAVEVLKRTNQISSWAIPVVFAFLIVVGCNSALKVFGNEQVIYKGTVTTIPFEYENAPFVNVQINSKTYRFLVDTGAPTIISTTLFNELNVQKAKEAQMGDSQGVSKERQFIVIPEMSLGSLVYTNIGAVVTDFDGAFEIDCMGYDGILGANQMAISVWKFDYQKKEIQIAASLDNFDTTNFEILPFQPKRPQMTPMITGDINGNKVVLTYDSGYTGSLKTSLSDDKLATYPSIIKYGITSAGIYGAGKSEPRNIYKIDSISLGNITLQNKIIDNDVSSLIGNELLDNYVSIIDWKTNQIYWKEVNQDDLSNLQTFGFGYRLNTMKAIVAYRIEEIDLPLKIGDTILSINNTSYENLDKTSACLLTNNKIEKDIEKMTLRYLDNGKVQSIEIVKQTLLDD